MSGLPLLPGNSFRDPTKTKYHKPQTLGFRNGYTVTPPPKAGIGGEKLTTTLYDELPNLSQLAINKPEMIYGQANQAPEEDYIPAHVAFDKKVLCFQAFYKQAVHESADEYYRIRFVKIYYYLEDDSIAIVEPPMRNSGMPQGKLLKRQRLPKDDFGSTWHWKDINLGVNLSTYGKVFHIYDCDKFTQDYLESEGIVMNPPEIPAPDPYIEKRNTQQRTFATKSDEDKLKKFLTLDKKVLRFFCIWDDRDNMFGELRPFVLHYYLVDDTIEIREVRQQNSGRDPFPSLMSRQKIPLNRNSIPSSFPTSVLELSSQELKDYIVPSDLRIGRTLNILGRRFLLYDCDLFTQNYYYQHYNITDFTPIDVMEKRPPPPRKEIPPYNGFGSLEDSEQSCKTLIPQPPKKDFMKMLEFNNVILRYEAKYVNPSPEDATRRFVFTYRLADDLMLIYEPRQRNSGIIGGKFLERTRVVKPGCDPNRPEYYGPKDFTIGSVVVVYGHKFVITDADDYVFRYIEENPDQFPSDIIESMRKYKIGKDKIRDEKKQIESKKTKNMAAPVRNEQELDELVRTIQAQLKRENYMNSHSLQEAFLQCDKDRSGRIDRDELATLCEKFNLPCDAQLLRTLINRCDMNNDGLIDYWEFSRFLNWN
ncbi:EF-hand domain-containing protein 1 [Trichoplax sp. H2]|uniref:EF-hand domain-containing protein 1 n=1 Tax=Trichoplax adhaerens TaxID=10228 RepID=B3SDH5_TRIAD|nr:hypothetical protein TRIADDRAFT_38534 [Trichoplax adhaerens]EDV19218.1 hypothetical protein TRIADDRAFT_38534 [Trichoplax adhaerens]RDD38978.1 EF-hand domain-containing protein 1 [Trichoplax sp. H2]|eukprot:XP_002118284.1 hypothetical protein TRIADDRAFT_38534 [Trichoplax adhaerens]